MESECEWYEVSGVGDKFCNGAMENWGKWDGRIDGIRVAVSWKTYRKMNWEKKTKNKKRGVKQQI